MLKTLRDKITISGVAVLMVGVALLIFTFFSAYGFLTNSLSIVASGDLAETFGVALAPLIGASIQVMYLGVMGWISSILTVRGVTILSQARQTAIVSEELQMPKPAQKEASAAKKIEKETVKEPEVETQKPEAKPPEAKPQETKQEEPKPKEIKPYEPEIVILTPEPMTQVQKTPQPPPKKENNQ